MTDKVAKLQLPGYEQPFELPIYQPTLGYDVIDIRSLSKAGVYTYDPGFMSTAACESKITYIDGEKGILLYRGYPIDELAQHSDFLEVAHLLLLGELPNVEQKKKFIKKINNHTMVHEQIHSFFNGFRRDAHPMAIMVGVVGALSSFYHDSLDITVEDDRQISARRMIAKIPTIAAMCYRYSVGHPFVYPRNVCHPKIPNRIQSLPGHWIKSLSCTQITNRMLPLQQLD